MTIETGQILRFEIPARSRSLWLSPAWAVLCGLVTSSAFVWTGRDVLIAALAVIIADGAWATQWWGLVETDWRQLFANWSAIPVERSESSLALRGSPADRSQHSLSRWRVWWQAGGREQGGTPLFSTLAALALGVLLSAVIGGQALALTLAAFAVTQIALILRLHGRAINWLHGFVAIGLPWWLGHAAFGEITWLSALAAIVCSFAFAAMLDLAQGVGAARRWLLPQIVLVIVLIALQQPIAAVALISLLAAQALLATVLHTLDLARAAQWWLMLAMLVVALGIR
jgi:chlorophyll synthase